jgi:hypothetical protein
MVSPPHEEAGRGLVETARPGIGPRVGLAALIAFFTIACCLSLAVGADYQSYIRYDGDRLGYAIASAAAFYFVSLPFVFTRFSFGYFVGFNFFTMVLGFLWLGSFSSLHYDHGLAAISAAASAVLFLLPAVLINAPVRQVLALTAQNFERLVNAILLLSLATILGASLYNFRLISLAHIYDFRNELYFPGGVRYLIGIVSSALLPFAFAYYMALDHRWRAASTLLLMLLFYPITLSKLAFFAPVWSVAVLVLSRFFGARVTTILLILLPMLFGLAVVGMFPHQSPQQKVFGLINMRMIATPSSAMDIYSDFFASHPLTHFCQVSILKPLVNCPYQEPLSVVMDKVYRQGNLNASLFATEGIASVGPYFAPLIALICGLVIAIGNRASAGLPSRFVLVSSALIPQILLNVPFTTALLTHGVVILFLLWYVMPREIFHGHDDIKASSSRTSSNSG